MKSKFSIEDFNTLKNTKTPYIIPDKVNSLIEKIERRLARKMEELKNAKNDQERNKIILKTVIDADFVLTKEDIEYVKRIYSDAGFNIKFLNTSSVDPYADGRFHPAEYIKYTKITLS